GQTGLPFSSGIPSSDTTGPPYAAAKKPEAENSGIVGAQILCLVIQYGLKKFALRGGFARFDEKAAVELRPGRAMAFQIQALEGDAVTLLQELRELALAAHARAEIAVVILAAAHLPDQ